MRWILLFAMAALSTSCITHSQVENMSGVNGLRGEPITYQTTTSYAIHGLFVFDLIGDGSKTNTVEKFMEEASDRGGSRARISQTSSMTYWFIFPPLSFFIHPVITSVEGDIEGMVMDEEDEEDAE